MKKIFSVLMALFLVGCGKEEAILFSDLPLHADITIITPLAGVGDNGYNDEALAGVIEMANAANMEVSLLRPQSLQQAGEFARLWAEDSGSGRGLLVLPDAEYSEILGSMTLPDTKSVLLFENDGRSVPAGTATFRISRYGAAYLSGVLARGSETVHIVFGNKRDPASEEAASGFAAGYLDSRGDGKISRHYLSESFSGWSMPDSLYRIAASYPSDFFFPLAKGSNAGVYKFSRESPFVLMLIAGMDVDCSAYSKRVPFSMIIDVRGIVKDYVSRWIAGENIAGHRDFGLKDGASSVKLSSLFYEINDIWEDYYRKPEYWSDAYDANYDEAVKKESEYEASR